MTKISNSGSRALTTTTTASPRVRINSAPPDEQERKQLLPPLHRGFSSIPAQDVLEKLIAQAVSALRRGIYWDRGSILNILV